MGEVELLETMIRRLWETEDPDAVTAMFSNDARIHGLEEMDLMGPQEFAVFHHMVQRQFRDIRIHKVQAVEQDDWAAMAFRVTAVERENKRKISCIGYVMARFSDGRVIEGMNFLDFLTLFEQAGRLPPRTRDMCLVGNRLTLNPTSRKRAH